MKLIVAVLIMLFSALLTAVDIPRRLIEAIACVESGNNAGAVGDRGKAAGKFQIHKIYVDEVNRISGIRKLNRRFTYEDRFHPEKSREMVMIYLTFWGHQYEKDTGQKAKEEVFAKIHNGHAFWKRSKEKNPEYFNNLEKYWIKVKKAFHSKK